MWVLTFVVSAYSIYEAEDRLEETGRQGVIIVGGVAGGVAGGALAGAVIGAACGPLCIAAGAIIGGAEDTAEAKMKIMAECGIHVVKSPADIGETMAKVLG